MIYELMVLRELRKTFCIDRGSGRIIPRVNKIVRWQMRAQKNIVHLVIPDPVYQSSDLSSKIYLVFIPFIPQQCHNTSQPITWTYLLMQIMEGKPHKVEANWPHISELQDSSSRLDTSHTSGDAKISPFECLCCCGSNVI